MGIGEEGGLLHSQSPVRPTIMSPLRHTVYTELALRRRQFRVAPAMQQAKSVISTPLPWILIIRAIKKKKKKKRIQSLVQNHMRHVRSESAREQRIALYKSYE